MFICVDRELMCVLYKHHSMEALVNVANIEIPDRAINVISATDPDSYEIYTDYELKGLYENIRGTNLITYNRPFILKEVLMAIADLKETPTISQGFAAAQAQYAEAHPDEYYQYIGGRSVPIIVDEPFRPRRMMTIPDPSMTDKPKIFFVPDPVSKVHKRYEGKGNPKLQAPHVPVPRAPSAPRDPNAPVEAPKGGSKTGRVWEIAEAHYAVVAAEKEQFGRTWDMKSFSKDVKALCISEGINPSTASVQYSKWKASKGL